MGSAEPLLQATKLRRVYGSDGTETVALAEATLQINRGEFVSIMGASGSGKSTLLHVLGLLDRPTSGTYTFAGQDTSGLTDIERAHIRNQKIGFVFQSFHLLARTTVLENVTLPLQYSTVPASQHASLAQTALEQVGLSHRLDHTPSQLSGGERQRVAIARALINKPDLVMADEPTGNLDSKTGTQIMELIDQLHAQGHTIILVTHETPVANYARRIIRMRDGTIASDEKVKAAHKHVTK